MSDSSNAKWEYCLLTANSTSSSVTFYRSTGAETVQIDLSDLQANDDVTVITAAKIAELGLDGWELVNANSIVYSIASTEMFFKRIIR